MKKEIINIISTCPSCGSLLVRVNDQLFCRSNTCVSKVDKQIEKFCKVLGLKGFGPKTIEKLSLDSIADIFTLTKLEYVDKLGPTVGSKLFGLVSNLKEVTLTKLLAAFSIPGLGETTAAKLASVISSIEEINLKTCQQVLGEKTAKKVADWFKENSSIVSSLTIKITNTKETKSLTNLKVCVTGKVNNFTRQQLKDELAKHGVSLVNTVSNNIDYLVCENKHNNSSKLIKAKQQNIKIITYEQLIEEILYGE